MGRARTLLVGLDGAEAVLIARLMEAGRLPTLCSLRADGTSGTVASPAGLGDDAAWTSFATGHGPGEHGRFHHQAIRAGDHRPRAFRRDDTDGSPFWETLDRAGKRVAVLDVPKAPIGYLERGCALADWMPHGPDTSAVIATPSWLDELVSADCLRPAGFDCDHVKQTADQFACFVDSVAERLALRTSLTCRVLAKRDWDVLLTVIAETHCVGHQCWHFHDESHPDHGGATGVDEPLERIYTAADAALGTLLEVAEPSVVVVFSLLGMGPNYSGNHLLPAVLERLDDGAVPRRRFEQRAVSAMKASLPERIKRRAPDVVRARSRGWDGPTGRFFPLDHDLPSGAVRINLAGREPRGRVDPGEEYDTVLGYLERELNELRRADTGDPAVIAAARTTERYPGPFANSWADLVVEWNRQGPLTALRSPRIGTVTAAPPHDRSGNHLERGWFVAAGPGFPRRKLPGPMQVTDLTAAVVNACSR